MTANVGIIASGTTIRTGAMSAAEKLEFHQQQVSILKTLEDINQPNANFELAIEWIEESKQYPRQIRRYEFDDRDIEMFKKWLKNRSEEVG